HSDSKVTENPVRRRTGRLFNFLVRFLTPLYLKDTQCGFKLYPAAIAKKLFEEQKSTGWAHDVELLYRAQMNEIPIIALPVTWEAKDGSKISPAKDALPMLLSVLGVTLRMKWDYFFRTPISIVFSKNEITASSPSQKNEALFRMLFAISTIILFFMMTSLSFHYGVSG